MTTGPDTSKLRKYLFPPMTSKQLWEKLNANKDKKDN